MKKYPEYKDSGVEWIGEIPSSWELEKLKYKSELKNGYSFKSEDLSFEENIPVIRIGDLQNGLVDIINAKKVSTEIHSKTIEFELKRGDILLALTGATIGKSAVYKHDRIALLNQRVGCIRPHRSLIKDFLKYYLQSEYFRESINLECIGGAQENIGREQLSKFILSSPSVSEQTIIANFLDHKTQLIDDLIAKKERLIELLKEERTAVINQAVTKGLDPNVPMKDSGIEWLGEIPEHWEVKKLKLCTTKIGSGVTPRGGSAVYKDYGIPLIRSQNVRFEGLDLSDVAYISEDIYKAMKNSLVLYNDLLLNITGASIGRCCIYNYNSEANVNQHVCIIRTIKNYYSPFINLIIQSTYGQNLIQNNVTGSGREGLNLESISNFKLCIPDYNEQEKIVSFINNELNKNSYQISNVYKQIDYMNEYKTSLINEAVTGKIDVRDF